MDKKQFYRLDPTSETLDEVISQSILIGPIDDVRERLYQNIKLFIEIKFGEALEVSKSKEKAASISYDLDLIFQELTKRKVGKF